MSNKPSLVEWLSGLAGIFDAKPIKLSIGGVTYEAVSYKRNLTAPESARNPGPYVSENIYVLGKRPDTRKIAKRPESKSCFRFDGDNRDWYVACYSPDTIEPQHREYSPFGRNFILSPWDIKDLPNSKIDDCEPKPYTRIPAKVE